MNYLFNKSNRSNITSWKKKNHSLDKCGTPTAKKDIYPILPNGKDFLTPTTYRAITHDQAIATNELIVHAYLCYKRKYLNKRIYGMVEHDEAGITSGEYQYTSRSEIGRRV